mmetsp:Transcript_7871/g.19534  ORF Transcript_7871/g.19534 Transcript_7871/m.19534 type:complete len:432 (+) Transcript_7871:105-1400(+)|eukprot:CAMPEP_0197179604 /NCGR_PEP_ID=MMETSP1423-20130617/4493_1 /TAXON_ID=476441 /ORGANISM="Pseudo-nitzschia heimii, Strain UNC1101" /LENGTH=431 /DNA_ID=CAMNT_0042629529 /DNA_START=70 /DNA_END=1365 /DNA_ORIENTATION=-
MPRHYESDTLPRRHRYSEQSGESMASTKIRRSGSDVSDGSGTVNYLASHLRQTASFDYNEKRDSYREDKENQGGKVATSRSSNSSRGSDTERNSLENNYSRAMSQMNRADYGPVRNNRDHKPKMESSNRREKKEGTRQRDAATVSSRGNGMSSDRRQSQSTAVTRLSNASTSTTTKAVTINVNKRSVSKKRPSEETIALFGAHGKTGRYFMERAVEAGYNVKAMIFPGMQMEDYDCIRNLHFITGSYEEVEKIQQVVENATYVVCLLNDCNQENFQPPVGNITEEKGSSGHDFNNLNFMHNLVPILQEIDTCRVLLYEASSMTLDQKGNAPFLSTIVKKMAVRRSYRSMKKEQDRIVKYISKQTKNAHFNYIITRPSGSIWDRPSRKKLAASKSQPGPFPITNSDLAEFTLSALRMDKIYNSCPYVVQDGI